MGVWSFAGSGQDLSALNDAVGGIVRDFVDLEGFKGSLVSPNIPNQCSLQAAVSLQQHYTIESTVSLSSYCRPQPLLPLVFDCCKRLEPRSQTRTSLQVKSLPQQVGD